MPVQSYDSPDSADKSGDKPTQGVGNAGGKPILPILMGVAAVIVLIVVTILLQRKPEQTIAPRTAASNRQIAQDSAPRVPSTGRGANTDGVSPPPGPAVAPVTPRVNGAGSQPEPRVNTTTPEEVGNGRNIVAPPGPAANNAQGMNR